MFGNTPFDPSKMDPKVLMELSALVQQLPPDQLNKMQQLMHNAMAGFDVRKEMEEFERNLPAGFREKMMSMVGPSFAAGAPGASMSTPATSVAADVVAPAGDLPAGNLNVREARLTILRAVAAGQMSPEDAEKLL